MSKNAPIPVPQGDPVLWLIQNPDAVAQVITAVNLLLAFQVKFTRAGLAQLNQQGTPILSGENVMVPLPILWAGGVPAPVATYSATANAGYTQAQLQALMDQVTTLTATLNLILAGEASWQTLPGAPA